MNGVAACLEYDTSSCMTPTFSSLDGHNAIWTSWDFLQIPTWPKPKTKNFLLWITSNRLCLHVGLEFWTIFSFTCSESTSFTTCKIRFYTLYTAKVYRELQVLYREIGLQGSHIYRDLSCVILLVIIRLILYKIKGIIGKS